MSPKVTDTSTGKLSLNVLTRSHLLLCAGEGVVVAQALTAGLRSQPRTMPSDPVRRPPMELAFSAAIRSAH
jgi:hypothetical protein